MHMPDILPSVVLAHHTIIHDQFQSTHMHQYLFTCNPGLGCFCIQVVLQIHFPSILRENQKINTDFLHPTHLVKNQEIFSIFSKDVSELLYLIGEKWLNSLSLYGRRVLVTLFHYHKRKSTKNNIQRSPRTVQKHSGGGERGGSNRLQRSALPIADCILSLIYAVQSHLCPKGFHYLPNLSGLKGIQENALDRSNLRGAAAAVGTGTS